MLDIVKKHLADLSAGKWNDYQAALSKDAVYEEIATKQISKGAEEYVKSVQRWKRAFPDLNAKFINGFAAGDRVLVEVEWEGTHSGPLEGKFGTFQPTNKKGRVSGAMLFTIKNNKITETRHYFDLLTILGQLGVAPMIGIPTAPQPKGGAGATTAHR